MKIYLERATLYEKPDMFAMMQRYIREFSAFEPVEPDGRGVYPYGYFDAYWHERERIPFFIMADGRRAGLILVNRNHYIKILRPSRSIAEFYVEPEFRRMGVGTAAARVVTESFGGWWQLMMHPKNYPSHSFWARTFDYEGAESLRVRTGPKWYAGGLRGQVMTFRSVGRSYSGGVTLQGLT